jgi:hypothetical protein
VGKRAEVFTQPRWKADWPGTLETQALVSVVIRMAVASFDALQPVEEIPGVDLDEGFERDISVLGRAIIEAIADDCPARRDNCRTPR